MTLQQERGAGRGGEGGDGKRRGGGSDRLRSRAHRRMQSTCQGKVAIAYRGEIPAENVFRRSLRNVSLDIIPRDCRFPENSLLPPPPSCSFANEIIFRSDAVTLYIYIKKFNIQIYVERLKLNEPPRQHTECAPFNMQANDRHGTQMGLILFTDLV